MTGEERQFAKRMAELKGQRNEMGRLRARAEAAERERAAAQAGWDEAFRLAAAHQDRADKAEEQVRWLQLRLEQAGEERERLTACVAELELELDIHRGTRSGDEQGTREGGRAGGLADLPGPHRHNPDRSKDHDGYL